MIAVYFFIPLLALATPISIGTLLHGYVSYQGLIERGIDARATIDHMSYSSSSRSKTTSVKMSFVAMDGKTYQTSAFWDGDHRESLRAGRTIKILYDSANPPNVAPSLAHAKAQLRAIALFATVVPFVFAFLGWLYWDHYGALFARVRGTSAAAGLPA